MLQQHDHAHEMLKCCWRALQVSDKMDPGQLVSLVAALNPENTPGRLTVIIRMGAEKVPSLCRAHLVSWSKRRASKLCSGVTVTMSRLLGHTEQYCHWLKC